MNTRPNARGSNHFTPWTSFLTRHALTSACHAPPPRPSKGLFPLSYKIMIAQAGGNQDNLPTGSKHKKRELAKRNQLAPKLVAELTHALKFGSQNCADPLSLMQTCAEITNRIDTATKRMEVAREQPCAPDPAWVDKRAKVNRKHNPASGVISGEALAEARSAEPVKEKKRRGDGSIPVCKCGSTDHQRVTHSDCRLNSRKTAQNAVSASSTAAETIPPLSLPRPVTSGNGKKRAGEPPVDSAAAAESPVRSARKRPKSDSAAAATPTGTSRAGVELFRRTAPAGAITISQEELAEIVAKAVAKIMDTDQGDERD